MISSVDAKVKEQSGRVRSVYFVVYCL